MGCHSRIIVECAGDHKCSQKIDCDQNHFPTSHFYTSPNYVLLFRRVATILHFITKKYRRQLDAKHLANLPIYKGLFGISKMRHFILELSMSFFRYRVSLLMIDNCSLLIVVFPFLSITTGNSLNFIPKLSGFISTSTARPRVVSREKY